MQATAVKIETKGSSRDQRWIEELDRRLASIEIELDLHRERLLSLDDRVALQDESIDTMRQKLHDALDRWQSTMKTRLQMMIDRIDGDC